MSIEDKGRNRAMVRKYKAVMKPVWRRCYFTWPFGHDFSLTLEGVECCRYCYKPHWLTSVKAAGRYYKLRVVFGRGKREGVYQSEWPT